MGAAVAAGVAGVVVLSVVATGTLSGKTPALASTSRRLSEIVVQPPPEECAKIGDNCVTEKCCKITGYTYIANIDDCKKSLNYMGSEKDYGMEPWGEDLFAQHCMDLHGVDRVSAWDITTDGMCQAYRPEGEKKNKKWKPDCAVTSTAAMHPFMKPKDYFQCLKDTQR